jgi:hypothetical protein
MVTGSCCEAGSVVWLEPQECSRNHGNPLSSVPGPALEVYRYWLIVPHKSVRQT